MAVLSEDETQELWKECGKRIQAAREQQRISREDLAIAIGTEYQNLGEIERGEHGTKMIRMMKIADKLNVSIDYLVGRVEQYSEGTNEKIGRFVGILQTCTDEEIDDLMSMVLTTIKYMRKR